MKPFQEGTKKIGGVVCSQSNLGSKGKEAQRRLTAIALIITLSKTVSYLLYSTLFPRQVGRTVQVSLAVSAAFTGSLLSIQLTKVEGDVPTFIKLAVPLAPHIFEFRVSPQPVQARAFRLCFNEHPTSSARRLCLRQSIGCSYRALYFVSLYHATLMYSCRTAPIVIK